MDITSSIFGWVLSGVLMAGYLVNRFLLGSDKAKKENLDIKDQNIQIKDETIKLLREQNQELKNQHLEYLKDQKEKGEKIAKLEGILEEREKRDAFIKEIWSTALASYMEKNPGSIDAMKKALS